MYVYIYTITLYTDFPWFIAKFIQRPIPHELGGSHCANFRLYTMLAPQTLCLLVYNPIEVWLQLLTLVVLVVRIQLNYFFGAPHWMKTGTFLKAVATSFV